MTTRNVIRKDGWLYWLAYGQRAEAKRPTGTVNLCDTVWLAAGWTVTFICLGVVAILIVAGVVGGLVVCGMMIWEALLALIAWLANPNLSPLAADDIHHLRTIGLFFGICSPLLGLLIGLPFFFKTETGRLVAAYLRAKKDKACPIYEVV